MAYSAIFIHTPTYAHDYSGMNLAFLNGEGGGGPSRPKSVTQDV